MTTLRDALTEALDKSEAGELTAPAETPIEVDEPIQAESTTSNETAQERTDRLRDEQGRFAKAQQEAAEQAAAVQAEPVVQAKKPPTSWSKDQWESWSKLDPRTQEYIEKREADYAKGVSTYKGQWESAQHIVKAIEPFVPELQQYGIEPGQWIQNLGNAHRTLAMGSPEQKAQMFAKLATDYGVDLNALTGQPSNPQFGHIAQTVQTLDQKIKQFEQMQREQQEAQINDHIQSFAAKAPHFEAVRGTMGQLLQSGVATDLQTAYDKAIRLHDDIWSQEQAAQAKAQEDARLAEIAKKKAAAVSPRSTSPTGAMKAGNTTKSLRDELSEQFDAVTTGRF